MHLEVLDEMEAAAFVERYRAPVVASHHYLCDPGATPARDPLKRTDEQISDPLSTKRWIDGDREQFG